MIRIAGCLLLVLSISFFASAQSPWVAGKGKGYAQLGFTSIGAYSELFLSNGKSYRLANRIADRTLQLYGEYGIGPHTSVLVAVPFKFIVEKSGFDPFFTSRDVINTFSTLGNIQIAGRHNFIDELVVVSSQWTIELPTGGYDELSGLRGGLDAISLIPTVSIGKGFSKFYTYGSVGVAVRTNNYSGDFRASAEAGYKVIDHTYVVAVLDIVDSFEDGTVFENSRVREKGLYLNNQSFFAYGLKILFGIKDHFGMNAAYYGASSGNLVARSPSLNVGVYYKW